MLMAVFFVICLLVIVLDTFLIILWPLILYSQGLDRSVNDQRTVYLLHIVPPYMTSYCFYATISDDVGLFIITVDHPWLSTFPSFVFPWF